MASIHQKIDSFKKKFYLNLFLKGTLIVLVFVLGYFLFASILEYSFWFGQTARFLLLSAFILGCAVCFYIFLRVPLTWWLFKKGLNEEESARLIGNFFPSVADRLLNIIQLSSLQNDLAKASIEQISKQVDKVSFEQAVDFNGNKKYARYLIVPLAIIIILTFVDSTIFTKSPERILKFNQEFSPEAPFQFLLKNKNLNGFFNEDFVLELSLSGNAIPESCYIISGSQRWKMESNGTGKFLYTFEKVQRDFSFQFQSAGFFSSSFKLTLIKRPEISQLNVTVVYPQYTGKRVSEINNAGNLQIPEGSTVQWLVQTSNATKAFFEFASVPKKELMQLIDNQSFQIKKTLQKSDQYSISLENEMTKSKDILSYSIETIKDQFPEIVVKNLRDTILFKSILASGSLKDDYGISELFLHFEKAGIKKSIRLPIAYAKTQQNFYYNWAIDSLHLKPNDDLTYYFEVWDNDQVNGRKSSRSATYTFSIPTEVELKIEIRNQEQAAQNTIDEGLHKAKDLKRSIDEAQEKLKGKQSLNWEDKKMLEDLVTQKQKLDKAIDELQKENQLLEQKKDSFSEENDRIKEKSEQIQKLMNDLLDPETKKLFQELENLLKENNDLQQVQKMLEKIDRKEINLEKELERTLSLFKQLKFDYKLDQSINEIKSTIEKQENLIKKTDSLDKKGNQQGKPNDELKKEQEEIGNDTKNFEKSLDELKELGKDADQNDQKMPSKEEVQELEKSEEESEKSLENGDSKKSLSQQKKAAGQMKQMQKELEGMQNAAEMEMDSQNLESLRQIVHGLIKLSFDQENLIKEFNGLEQADPKMIQVSQNQIKVQDDFKVLEDSLLALSKRDPFMASIVTREIGDLNDHVAKSVNNIKERKKGNALSEMQFSMTSINNLALMLNEHFDMMMKMMANGKPSKSGKGKKSGNKPTLSNIQQSINDKIEKLKNGQKSGRQFSKELAQMAAEQERIRKALQQYQEKMKQKGDQGFGNDLSKKMEETEIDLINKHITEETIKRQKEIMTRLLETEKSMREQNLDKEREGETAKEKKTNSSPVFEEYLRLKEKEIELLKTIPPKLLPYYKRQVDEYFKRIN